ATATSLHEVVAANRFRADLLARLEGLTVVLPPLRERTEDIPFLFAKLIEQEQVAAAPPRFDPRLVERLCTTEWRFNVPGLARMARRRVALPPDAAVLDLDALPAEPSGNGGPSTQAPAPSVTAGAETGDPDLDIHPAAFLSALHENRGNVKRT